MNFLPYFLLLLACLLVTIKYRSKTSDFSNFALSKNSFGGFTIFATIVASFVGGGTIIGVAEKAYLNGIGPAIALLGFSVQLMLTGVFIAPRLIAKYSKSLTIGDIFASAYGNNAKVVMALGWFLFCCGIVTAQFSTLKYLLYGLCPENTDFCAILLAIFVTFYSALGGVTSVIRTDVIQFLFFVVVLPLAAYFAITALGNKDFASIEMASSKYLNPFYSMSPLQLLTTILIFVFADALIPPVGQRILISDDIKLVRRTYLYASFALVILVACAALIGMVTKLLNPSLKQGEMLYFMTNSLFGGIFRDVFITALIAVVISTADSYLNSCAVSITHDVLDPLCNLSKSLKLKFSQIITIMVGLSAIILSNTDLNIVDILVFSYKFWGPVMVVPLAFLAFGKIISRLSFYISTIIVMFFVAFWNFANLKDIYNIEDLIPAMLLDLFLFLMFYGLEKLRK